MVAVIKGKAPCPECRDTQDVKHDGRKYYINCTSCRTMTSYQSKVSQARLLAKLEAEPKDPDKPPALPAHQYTAESPEKRVVQQAIADEDNKSTAFFSDFNLF